ncbi:MAG: hypothetical protein ACM3PW_10295 [Chlamydiota bacterium]
MRLTFMVAVVLFLNVISLAQDRSLGEVARESRASKSRQATKVFTDEEMAPKPLTSSDDPIKVISNAALGLSHNTNHRCRKEAEGNSGPGWAEITTIEVSGDDRMHVTLEPSRASAERREMILIGDDLFVRDNNGPWRKTAPASFGLSKGRKFIPDPLNFAFQPGDLKYLGREVIEGVPAFLYVDVIHAYDLERTIKIWVGTDDGLPRRTEMQTAEPSSGMKSHETYSCSYGVVAKIEAPI